MRMLRLHRGFLVAAIAALVIGAALAACVTPSGRDERQAAHKGTGARIEMGVGHFNRGGKPFHYWDKQKEIPAACARCHAAEGVPQYLKEGKNTPAPHVKNAYACTNCHSDMLTYERHRVTKVNFAGGASVDSGHNDTNLCMTCHQGRESTASVNKALSGRAADVPDPKIAFVHVHYYPAGATLYGTEARVAYEYEGRSYAGLFGHVPGMNTCTACHDAHRGELQAEKCGACHQGGKPEARARAIERQKSELYAAIQQYARAVGGAPIAFSPEASPYWYADRNGNGRIDPDELNPANSYKAYTPRLLQAVYNYTFALRDPGAAYHNGRYVGQILHDSLESLAASGKAGMDMTGRTRP